MRRLCIPMLACAVFAGCGHESTQGSAARHEAAAAAAPAPAAGAGDTGALLAYAHAVDVTLDAGAIPSRLSALRAACDQGRFGACVVLDVSEDGGERPSASLGLRIVPAGVEPIIALAAEGAEPGSRRTHAEDLAVAVRDNDQLQDRLRREREQLLAFQQRDDLAVADMIALSRQLAETEAALQAAADAGAGHRRRIDTHLVRIALAPGGLDGGMGEIGRALGDVGGLFAGGIAWTIRAVAGLAPAALLAVLVLLAVRGWRRRRARRA